MRQGYLFLLILPLALPVCGLAAESAWISAGRAPDSTEKTLSEIRAAEKRKIPIEVAVKASEEYAAKGPVAVTVIVTNLFDNPLLINRRMLVNHLRLQGELSFRILGPDGKPCEIQRLVTPMSLTDEDFVILPRGQSVQRSVDLADIYDLKKKGTYKLIAIYHNDVDQPLTNLRAWKGLVASEPLEIRLN